MIVIGDADVIRNDVDYRTGSPVPLGYDKYTRELFGNRDFILNCVNYLCDDSGLISVRSRQVRLRLLDEPKIRANRAFIQMQNVLFPISIILLAGVVVIALRKRRFSK
jgi:ABC-2 type transport system permease protein